MTGWQRSQILSDPTCRETRRAAAGRVHEGGRVIGLVTRRGELTAEDSPSLRWRQLPERSSQHDENADEVRARLNSTDHPVHDI
jgi:hypothetical protein